MGSTAHDASHTIHAIFENFLPNEVGVLLCYFATPYYNNSTQYKLIAIVTFFCKTLVTQWILTLRSPNYHYSKEHKKLIYSLYYWYTKWLIVIVINQKSAMLRFTIQRTAVAVILKRYPVSLSLQYKVGLKLI